MNDELRHVRYFVAVAEEASFHPDRARDLAAGQHREAHLRARLRPDANT